MKKRDKQKGSVPDVAFKQYTAEEDRIYVEAVEAFRNAVASGRKLADAYAAHPIADPELRSLVHADFLKILIAERHFGGQESLEKLAADLGVTLAVMQDTRKRMLQEVGAAAADQFTRETGGTAPKTDD